MIVVAPVTRDDDLQQLVDKINSAAWDKANAMCRYEAEALSDYLDRQDTLFIACHDVDESHCKLLGLASARLAIKPYDNSRWLYVDEVDVCADQRRRGAGKAIMQKLIELAEQADCDEVWLGTEDDNRAANALYRSLDPDEVDKVIGYTYKIHG